MAGQDRVLAKLREVLDQPDTVILAGSGISLWSGLPSWTGLLHALADTLEEMGLSAAPVRQEINSGNLLLAASYAVHQIHKRELGAFLRKALRHPYVSPSELHRSIAALGPSCFITTNYDQLLETAIRQSGQHIEPRVVTNRQPVEIADIIPASARNFVFKYHGDLGDAESIILSREQYRQIKNDYPGMLRALSTLLATRPVLIIGFGLQDPDFLLVQDELVSIFQGQAGEYFAMQPDFDDLRINYWRKNYRTEVISYDTMPKPDGTRDHSQLLAITQELHSEKFRRDLYRASSPGRMPPGHLLLLARLAASVARQRPAPLEVSFPLSVELEINPKSDFRPHPGRLADLLRVYEGHFLLLGHPGAGKSFALKEYAAELAHALTRRCLSDAGDIDEPHVPIFVDLTFYRGNMGELIQTALPVGLELSDIFPRHRCTVVLDAANEMPREYIENERWVHDFAKLNARFPEARFLIGCRNEAWVKVVDLPIFIIRDIDSKFVKEQLSGIVPDEALGNPALTQALSTPLLFSLVKTGSVVMPEAATPSGLYEAYWAKLNAKWKEATGETIDFASTLENVAYSMLENGVEYAPKVDFERALSAQFRRVELPLTALLRDGTLIALSGQRVSFFHQSLTEQLAAGVIARQFEANPATLKALLSDKRWDQALFLAAGSLRQEVAEDFIRKILETDVVAGARAAYYVRREQADVIDSILQQAINRGTDDLYQALDLSSILEALPYSNRNVAR
jgi:SIR2-like domain